MKPAELRWSIDPSRPLPYRFSRSRPVFLTYPGADVIFRVDGESAGISLFFSIYKDLRFRDDMMNHFRSTTILCLRHGGKVVMAGDGQVTLNNSVMKHGAKKIRKIFKEKVVAGFAGSAADSFALFSRFESKLEEYNGNLERAAVELARDWRTDRALRRLEALMIVADREKTYLISGTGDLIEPDDGVLAIGSGGTAALAAAKALVSHAPDMGAEELATEAMKIAAEIDVYTNSNIITVVL